MSLKIGTRDINNVTIVDLSGRVTLGEATGKLRDAIRNLVDSGKKNIVLDLKALDYMDSAGLGEIVGAYTTITNSGGKLKMLKAQGRALDLLQVTRLMTLFELYDNEADAVKSFS